MQYSKFMLHYTAMKRSAGVVQRALCVIYVKVLQRSTDCHAIYTAHEGTEVRKGCHAICSVCVLCI